MTRPATLSADLAVEVATACPLIVFDGVCVLCSGFVQWVLARDRAGLFRFTPAQGPLGQALYRDLRLDPVDLETNLLVVGATVYGRSDAVIEIALRLGGVWRLAGALRIIPRLVRDWLYDRVAKNRYRVFGRRETCWVPSPGVTDRVV